MVLAGMGVLLAAGCALAVWYFGPFPFCRGALDDAQSPQACWPWAPDSRDTPYPGVTRWMNRSPYDGTVAEFYDFDFAANPGLRLELYDQDEDDTNPLNNHTSFWRRGVGKAVRHLNDGGRGPVVAAWNGLFFQYRMEAARLVGKHVAPVVLRGQVYYPGPAIRWTFGVQYRDGRPIFRALHQPDMATLARRFDYAAAGACCLVSRGRPLALQPFPRPGALQLPQPVPCSLSEAGHVPGVDHIRTSRTSMGWSRDNRHFYLLIVRAPDSGQASSLAFKKHLPLMGGWTVADLQRFWLAQHVWGAVNIDGGSPTQLACLRPDGGYEVVPPRWATPRMRLTLPPDCKGAPAGGTLMYFYIRDANGKQGTTAEDGRGDVGAPPDKSGG